MPIFNLRRKAGSGAGQQINVRPADPFGAEHPLTAHLNKLDAINVQQGNKSNKPAGGYGADPGATFRRKK